MNRRQIAFMGILASIFVVTIGLAQQDRFALRSPNGISFVEFAGYETWQMVAASQADDGSGCGTSPNPGCIKSIVANPVMIKAFAEGIPANGEPVPDGAMFAKIEWAKQHFTSPYGITVPGKLAEVSFTMKDSKRFPLTHGWGYATFRYDDGSDTWTAFGDGPEFANKCHTCHTEVEKSDFVFTHFPKR